VESGPNSSQLEYDPAHLAITRTSLLAFLTIVALVAGRTLQDCAGFLRKGLRAEFAEVNGLFDLVMFVLFCVFVYSHAITERALSAFGLSQSGSDPQLWNSDTKTLATSACFIVSVIFVGLISHKNVNPRRNRH